MAWIWIPTRCMFGPYRDQRGDRQAAEYRGLAGRIEATGRGVLVVCDESVRYLNMPVDGCRW